MGRVGIVQVDRARYMATGMAAQFELLLRRRTSSGIGAVRTARNGPAISPRRTSPGWRWRMKTSKSKYRAAAEFDLTSYSMLFPLLEAVPPDQRVGEIIEGEHGLPVRERSYRKWPGVALQRAFRTTVWSVDSRPAAPPRPRKRRPPGCHPGALTIRRRIDAALHQAQPGQDRDCRRGTNRKRATDEKGA